ncbi:amidohydrolase [Congregibacter variabilis]|uniref:Amidohydrolase n=1 Tax=Congregibacter variabilis TaxID=3081200 RepID=A0ABZ0I712_9GAMM|nr:amidohydrolase [Congregibacter sp. IMCC43200]
MPKSLLPQRILLTALSVFSVSVSAQLDKAAILDALDSDYGRYQSIAETLWSSPELGYLEVQSTRLLQDALQEEGFTVEAGVAGMPTAFTASFGSGGPVIGILGEYDALPGMSQAAVPYEEPLSEGAPGQACGHHLFGTASLAAAVAVKNWLVESGTPGTIRYYGTPAEEGGSGKVYMVRAGLFNDVDAVISWHASDANTANPGTNLATISGKFRFTGRSAHAAAAPERGRSALDGVEAMNDMVNMLREHTTEPTRIHYVITDGGNAPNIVPKTAEVYYVIRHEDVDEVRSVWARVVRTAEGAAMGTETSMEYEIIGGTYPRLPNEALASTLHANLTQVGGVEYSKEDLSFAREIQATLSGSLPDIASAGVVQPKVFTRGKASADTGDVSWNVPMAAMRAATWVPGTPAHSWQAVAAGGTSIGYKGMMVAAKTLALSAVDLYTQPELLTRARAEFEERIGPDFQYEALLGDREPALDYRK